MQTKGAPGTVDRHEAIFGDINLLTLNAKIPPKTADVLMANNINFAFFISGIQGEFCNSV